MRGAVFGLIAITVSWALVPIASADEQPTIEWDGGDAALGLGGSWGSGVLHYQGYDYGFDLADLKLAGLGVNHVTGSAKVYNLTKPEDLNGTFVGPGIGLTVAAGGGVATVQNQNGVRLDIISTGQGLYAWVGARGVHLDIPASTIASVQALKAAENSANRAEEASRRADAGAVRVEAAVDKLERTVAEAERRYPSRRGTSAPRATAGVGAR